MVVASLSALNLINLGPLTTTYTPPAACATETARVAIARTNSVHNIAWFEDCEQPQFGTFGSCLPYGAERDADALASEQARHSSAVYYHSPGIACPESWTTAGVAARVGNEYSIDGIFGTTRAINLTTTIEIVYPTTNPVPNILREALEPSETAVVCCPSGFTANEGIGCHKTLPLDAYTAPSVCKTSAAWGMSYEAVTYTYLGEAITGVAEICTDPAGAQYATMTAEPPTNPQFGIAATYVPAVTLILGGGSNNGGGAVASDTGSNTLPTATATATPTGSSSSAATTPTGAAGAAPNNGESSADSTLSSGSSTDSSRVETTAQAASQFTNTVVSFDLTSPPSSTTRSSASEIDADTSSASTSSSSSVESSRTESASPTLESGDVEAVQNTTTTSLPQFTVPPGAGSSVSRAMMAVWGVAGLASVILFAL
jgi:hypothetical protein